MVTFDHLQTFNHLRENILIKYNLTINNFLAIYSEYTIHFYPLKVPPMFFPRTCNCLLIILGNQFRFFGSHHNPPSPCAPHTSPHWVSVVTARCNKVKLLCPKCTSRFYHQMIRRKYRHKEVCIDIGYYNSQLSSSGTAKHIFLYKQSLPNHTKKSKPNCSYDQIRSTSLNHLHRHSMPEFYIPLP